eukprot:10725524-Heterocapsa_arctica.AAC.1
MKTGMQPGDAEFARCCGFEEQTWTIRLPKVGEDRGGTPNYPRKKIVFSDADPRKWGNKAI